MTPDQSYKYGIVDNKIVNRATGIAIPDDEPVFILRAKDRAAMFLLDAYLDRVENETHADSVAVAMRNFQNFAKNNSDRMKEPDTNTDYIVYNDKLKPLNEFYNMGGLRRIMESLKDLPNENYYCWWQSF
jgi:hypothetical protein